MVDMRTREGRAIRETTTRDVEARTQAWQPASKLPNPEPVEGVRFRWIRTATWGQSDPGNVSMRFREGWVPVLKEDHPELAVVCDFNSKFPANIEIGGLLLCRIDEQTAMARQKYYEEMARNQIRASDQNLMRQQDPRMPLLKPERSTRVTFGGGSKPE